MKEAVIMQHIGALIKKGREEFLSVSKPTKEFQRLDKFNQGIKQGLFITPDQSAINNAIDYLGVYICNGEVKAFDKETVEGLGIKHLNQK